MTTITQTLFENADESYKNFHQSIVPTLLKGRIIGVRVPVLRKIAKQLKKDESSKSLANEFLQELPHEYYDEEMLHAIILSDERDFSTALERTREFLPYIDNWAVCDTFCPKAFCKNKNALWREIEKWLESEKTFTVRFGIVNAMRFFLDEDFSAEKMKKVLEVSNEDYYVRMAIAWYMSVALVKQWEVAIKVVEGKSLGAWVHNKSIQKSCESFRLSAEQKQYLKTLKIHE